MRSLKTAIEEFKGCKEPTQSTITLAGTGPNGAAQVEILNELGIDYLRSVKSIDVISGGAFSLFIYIANQLGQLNVENFKNYESFVKSRHKLPLYKKLAHLAVIKFSKKSLYPNTHIKDTFLYLFGAEFGSLSISDLDCPVTFYSYDTQSQSVIALNKNTYPDMALIDVARACISVPPIHGSFDYRGVRLTDTIFSPSFTILRKKLFKKSSNHLFVNHKKTQKTSSVYFLAHSNSRYPDLRLFIDFAFLYLGIPNKCITQTNHKLLSKGIISGL